MTKFIHRVTLFVCFFNSYPMGNELKDALTTLKNAHLLPPDLFSQNLEIITEELTSHDHNQKKLVKVEDTLNTIKEIIEKDKRSCCSLCNNGQFLTFEETKKELEKKENDTYTLRCLGISFIIGTGIMSLEKITKILCNQPFTLRDLDIVLPFSTGCACVAGSFFKKGEHTKYSFLVDDYEALLEKHNNIATNYTTFMQWYQDFKKSKVQWSNGIHTSTHQLTDLINGQRWEKSVTWRFSNKQQPLLSTIN